MRAFPPLKAPWASTTGGWTSNISEQEPLVIGSGQTTDFLHPSILLYEPQMDSSLELVGIENVVFAEMWETRGHVSPPTFQGVA